ncbi:SRPBCC domain-containing protein [Mucilaginibacter jinjuensis]|uniref:SRPBCC domain-containing protein n=1 Tax=Mucilaginibacter jinjuensis TaxID=1176721 RepID=A0ABY7T9A2_9SPHI|nr:SRPBCC domain-containing protein [Mucilaginibacter jinjuensis]WCT11782.1 SRPBCC domain-containing protein [Mucilaginibacter jinjuensis]
METSNPATLRTTTTVNAPIEKVWELWTGPEHIKQWNNMSEDWHTSKVEIDLRPGGKFLFVMGLKDGSFSFDYTGTYDEVIPHELITCTLSDGRKNTTVFSSNNPVTISETFDPDNNEPIEMQQRFCQAVLDNFKRYAERE